MKQFALLVMLTVACGLGSLVSPFWGVLLYYLLSTLRPQNLWDWALPYDVRWSLIAAAFVFLSVIFHSPRLVSRMRINVVTKLMIAYGCLVVLSVVGALNPHVAEMWAVEYGKVLAIAILASFVIEHLWQVRLLGAVVLFAVGFIAYEINHAYLFRNGRLDVFHYGYGGLDNNGAGLMLAMGLPFAIAFASCAYERWPLLWRGAACFAGVMIMHAVMMTYSRGAMVAAVVGILWHLVHHRPKWQAFTGAAVLFAVALVLAGPEIREEFLSTRDYHNDASARARFESWDAAWTIAWDFPLLGAGVRNSNLVAHGYGADIVGRTIHNQYLQVAADSGVPAAVCYIAMLVVAGCRLRGVRRAAIEAIEDRELDLDRERELDTAAKLALAAKSSLVVFAFGGVFLSLEVFELPWLLLVMAGVMPYALDARLSENERDRESKPEPLPVHDSKPVGALA